MRAKSIKFVEKNIVENLSDFGLDKDFSNSTKHTRQMLNCTSSKLKCFPLQKTFMKMKR